MNYLNMFTEEYQNLQKNMPSKSEHRFLHQVFQKKTNAMNLAYL